MMMEILTLWIKRMTTNKILKGIEFNMKTIKIRRVYNQMKES